MKKEKDNFSKQSARYQKFRPRYPEALIDRICEHLPVRNLAWDCATGNGQIATILSGKFQNVIATDISREQLKIAPQKENITYKVERAEKASLPDTSVDLIVVAQAIHWFDFEHFYAEAKRVLKKGGILAVVGYPLLTTENSELNRLITYLYRDVLGNYWDAERKYIDDHYMSIPFPFEEFQLPEFEITYNWTFEQLTGYLETWSAVNHYQRNGGTNPLNLIEIPLRKIFYDSEQVKSKFKIIGRYGKV